ncbi:PREDICTED: fatty acid-binding protein, heart-like [Priapulus caudatus]|uniref:Fatty acid-binding protein, heart-like n=1 Tax=Priapulus caudatus TaxID=37621 RepID=A0ABM1EU06_PRICU|nr:PREDICTED: fatty acid-binding protein, heart-like [Priapulus caudatus]
MASFCGKFELVSSENFEELCKVLGVPEELAKAGVAAKTSQEISMDGDDITVKLINDVRTTANTFRLGEEFDETTPDGRLVKSIVALDGDKMVQVQRAGDIEVVITREMVGDGLRITIKSGAVVCVRVYKSI